jgi:hypothetical protein
MRRARLLILLGLLALSGLAVARREVMTDGGAPVPICPPEVPNCVAR